VSAEIDVSPGDSVFGLTDFAAAERVWQVRHKTANMATMMRNHGGASARTTPEGRFADGTIVRLAVIPLCNAVNLWALFPQYCSNRSRTFRRSWKAAVCWIHAGY